MMSTAKPSGYGAMQIGGQERPFQVGTNQGDIFQRLRHVSLKDYSALFSPAALQAEALTGGDLRDFVYSALVAGYENDGLPVDFSHLDVGNWIDDAPLENGGEVVKPLTEMLQQLVRKAGLAADRAKNAAAPTLEVVKGPELTAESEPTMPTN